MNFGSQEHAPGSPTVDPFLIKLHGLTSPETHVTPYKSVERAYIVQSRFGAGVTTLKINIEGKDNDEVVITNITTLPETEQGKGYAARAIATLVTWAEKNNFPKVIAAQVQDYTKDFWIKNGFSELPNGDFIYNRQ